MPNRPRLKPHPPVDHPRDLPPLTVRQPHVVTSTAFNAWHQQRYPLQRDAVQGRLHARHLDTLAPLLATISGL